MVKLTFSSEHFYKCEHMYVQIHVITTIIRIQNILSTDILSPHAKGNKIKLKTSFVLSINTDFHPSSFVLLFIHLHSEKDMSFFQF